MLKLYRRHLKECGRASMNYQRCRCPVWVVGTVNGKAVRKSLDTFGWDDAEAKLKALKPDELPGAVSLSQAIDRFQAELKALGRAPETIAKYDLLFRTMVPVVPENLKGIAPDDLARVREGWKISPVSARKRLERMKAFFRFCHERGWIPTNPAKPLKPPKGQPLPTLPFSEDEVNRIVLACDSFPNNGIYSFGSGERVKAFVLVLLSTGLRIRDAVMLTRERFEGGKLRLYTQKTGTHVHLPLKPEVLAAVMAVCGEGERPFWSGNGLPKSCVADWQRTLRKLFRLAGVENGHAHRYRDYFARRLLLKGVPLSDVSILLGHSSVSITERHYAPWILERQNRLEGLVMATW